MRLHLDLHLSVRESIRDGDPSLRRSCASLDSRNSPRPHWDMKVEFSDPNGSVEDKSHRQFMQGKEDFRARLMQLPLLINQNWHFGQKYESVQVTNE